MLRALGAGRQYSFTGAETFFSAHLQGAGVMTKAAPVFRGGAAGADGRNDVCMACAVQAAVPTICGTPSCSEWCRRKKWVLALQGLQ